MHGWFRQAGIVAATLSLAVAPAIAQVPNEEPAPETPAPQQELPAVAPEATPEAAPAVPPADDEAARAAHMSGLFERLSDPDSPDWERVQAQIRAAWNLSGSSSMDLLAMRADQAMEKKALDTALVHLNDLVRLAPSFAEGWNKRATVYFMKGEYGPSLEDIARTLELEPRHFGALSGLGIILDRIGDKRGALEAYRRAVAINPHLEGAQEGIQKLEKEVEGQRL